jgi:hypothetical protein
MAHHSLRGSGPISPTTALISSRWAPGVCSRLSMRCGEWQRAARLLMTHLRPILAAAAVGAVTGNAAAHHSLAMFDRDHPIELLGIVQEFRFTSPHTYILLKVERAAGDPVVWDLEGNSPTNLAWDGWSSTTIRPGDRVRMKIEPLRSGSPGGAWYPRQVSREDGTPVVPQRRYGLPR